MFNVLVRHASYVALNIQVRLIVRFAGINQRTGKKINLIVMLDLRLSCYNLP